MLGLDFRKKVFKYQIKHNNNFKLQLLNNIKQEEMKKMIFLFSMLFTFGMVNAQQETLFNRAHVIGAFGAPIVEYSFHGDDVTTSVGGGGGLIIDNFFIGGYGMGSIDESIFDDDLERIELGHGGFWLGYTIPSHKLLHFYSSVRLGWGGVNIDVDNDFNEIDGVFVIEPEGGVELNVFGFFRIAATVGYRYVDGINPNVSGLEKDSFNGMVGALTFRFGGFGSRKW